MKNFKFDLNDEEFNFECPECGHEITFNGKSINHDVICPHCHSDIYIDGKDFENQIKDIENQINSLF